jgi:hypothetical protein
MCGYSVRAGGFTKARSKLKRMGLIKIENGTPRALTR